jgi:hypothetical protein
MQNMEQLTRRDVLIGAAAVAVSKRTPAISAGLGGSMFFEGYG